MTENTAPIVTIMKDLVKPDEVRETHISYVFLTDDWAYKVKKPVDFGFLDFTQKKYRKNYCIVEKKLNERFSSDVYEKVLKVARKEKTFEIVDYDNTLVTVDYVLKMRRIIDKDFLSTRVSEGMIDADEMRSIGHDIAELLKSITTVEMQAEENCSAEIIRANVQENFQQTEEFKGKCFNESDMELIKDKVFSFMDREHELFESRIPAGLIKDGHGDLRLEHVYFDKFARIGLIDCIEFNRRMRYNDVVSDIAFLAMELDDIGENDLSDALMAGFFEVFDDSGSRRLLNFYKAYRAMVRIKVNCLMLAQKGDDWERADEVRNHIHRLTDLAVSYSLGMSELPVLIFYGMMAGGKSKNGKAFAGKYAASYLSTDIIRKQNAGINPTDRVTDSFEQGLYSHDNSLSLYTFIGDKAEEKNRLGRLCVVDGSFSKPSYFENFIHKKQFPIIKIKFTADESEIIRRLEKRKAKEGVSDGRVEIYQKQKENFTDIGADKTIVTDRSVEENLQKIVRYIAEDEN